ncbi:MAG TPA: hypothetical protein VGG33_03380, partial [Polyangia bacterium]
PTTPPTTPPVPPTTPPVPPTTPPVPPTTPPVPPTTPPVPPTTPPTTPAQGLCGANACPAASILMAACRPAGGCMAEVGAGSSRLCYASGVKVTVTPIPATLGLAMRVTRPDGQTPCYSIEFGTNLASGARGLVFRNGAGEVIATGSADARGRVTLTCDRASTEPLDDQCVPPASPGICLPGACR